MATVDDQPKEAKDAETDESVESTDSDNSAAAEANFAARRAIRYARSWLDAATDSLVKNFANALDFAEQANSRQASRRQHQSAAVSSQLREEDAQARRLLREWTETDDLHRLDLSGVLFLLLTVLALVVCPVVSIVKCPVGASSVAFTGPLKFKYHLSLAVNAASMATGLVIVAYVLLQPCLRSAFPVVETQRIGYSGHLLTDMHFTTGAVMAYKCIGQHQFLKKKYTEENSVE